MEKYSENVCKLLTTMLNIKDVFKKFEQYDRNLSDEENRQKIINYITEDYSYLSEQDRIYINDNAKQLLEYDNIILSNLKQLVDDKTIIDTIDHNITYVLCHMQISIITDFIKNRLSHPYHKNRQNILCKLFEDYTKKLKEINKSMIDSLQEPLSSEEDTKINKSMINSLQDPIP